jgi:hypothetical protein
MGIAVFPEMFPKDHPWLTYVWDDVEGGEQLQEGVGEMCCFKI